MVSRMAQHTSLLVCPKNLRECIDWLLCIHGRGKISELALAVQNVLVGSHSVSDDLEALASGLANFIGYSGSAVTGRGIVRRDYVKFFEDLSPSTCQCVSSSHSHDPSCSHCAALRPVFPGSSCSLLCACAQKFKDFVDIVPKAFSSLKPKVPQTSLGLSVQVKDILGKFGSVSKIDVSQLKTSLKNFTSAFDALQKAFLSVSSKAFPSTPGSPSKSPYIAEGLYGFLHSGVEGWSKALGRALEKAEEKASGNSLKSGSEEFKALVSALRAFFLNLKAEYASAYSSANWDSLCSYKSCSCFPLYACPPQGCCEKCPKRLCAKIFLGFIPALYFGLKIVFERCKDGSEFTDWHKKISMDSYGKPESALAKFLFAWGFSSSILNDGLEAQNISSLLKDLFNASSKPLQNLYNASLKYFSRSLPSGSPLTSDSPSHPSTVRSMLLWLYGLRFTSGFSDLVLYCSSLCSPFGNSFNSDAFCYYLHVSCFLLPVSVISFIETSESTVTKFFPDAQSEISKFHYPEDLFKLFDMLLDCIRKIYIPFNFLRFQCQLTPGQAGWQNCYFGLDCSVEPLSSSTSPCCSTSAPKGYLCTASQSISNKDVHGKHCAQDKCLNALPGGCSKASESGHNTSKSKPGQKCSNPCPHPLQRFLTATSDSKSQDYSPFRLPSSFARIDFSQTPPAILPSSDKDFLTMGFKDLPEKARKGQDLYAVLACFCDDGFYPVARLCEFALYVSLQPPETFLELYVFFRKFVYSDVFKTEFPNYASGEPGTFHGEYLRIAVQRLFNHSSKSHPYDLKSLYDCSSTKGSTCGKYLFPLYNVDGVFSENFLGLYLSFVCHLAPKLKALLEKFQDDFSKSCPHCSSGSCQKIVECPCALPFLYSWGFSFWSPGDLNCVNSSGSSRHPTGHAENETGKCTQKSCSDFVTQLRLVAEGKPFEALLRIIDEFIWHIRLPFIYAFLYIWILVISYFYYVQFYKLDLLHIDSHLHLPRSFKILPSTLFSDASSKLKDLSYFTL
ncbi:variant erythrocyte surface antigen-1 family protein [Babesia divergens]|uniref:Variant erythrocyte surface antigen-1 family protein n=1 Tax=Babesia divergens TaxID=32595 RepID=A0AAD9GDG0_BABDI|nr:variant erythrocyte surface antigen-1 family protein [Babesia divergens]